VERHPVEESRIGGLCLSRNGRVESAFAADIQQTKSSLTVRSKWKPKAAHYQFLPSHNESNVNVVGIRTLGSITGAN
jgi:hypothetical protein